MQNPNEAERPSPETMAPSSKRLVRILLIIGIGIPVLIESATLIRMIGGYMGGEEAAQESTPEATETYVVEGDELLPETPPAERIVTLTVEPQSEAWVFTMELDVENTTARPYELELGEVEVGDGQVVQQTVSQRWDAGAAETMAAEWRLPVGQIPSGLTARARWHIGTDSTRTLTRPVQFGQIPVQWRRD